MKIVRGLKADYAVRAAAFLGGTDPGSKSKSRHIAEAMDIPERFLPQVMAALVRAGLVTSTAGPGGGYELARPPQEISLLDVIRAVEGPVHNERCVMTGGDCSWDHACAAHSLIANARDAFESSLAASTVADISRAREGAHPAT